MFPYELVFTAGVLGMFFLLALASYVGGKIADHFRGETAPANGPAAQAATRKAA